MHQVLCPFSPNGYKNVCEIEGTVFSVEEFVSVLTEHQTRLFHYEVHADHFFDTWNCAS